MKTAVIYARYSCDAQTEQSIEGQLRVCEDYAKKNDILILDTYIDRAMTGTNDMRPSFQQMIKDSARKQWDYVLVYKFDRFSRNKYEATNHKHTLKLNGVKVLSAMENIPDTPEGIILETLLEGMNQYYSDELSQKVRRGMNETRQKGNFTGGYLIYGYKVENRKVIIDEEKAEVVRYIFEQYASGVFVEDIIASLTDKGIYNKGKPFARTTVYKMLQNEKYFGIYRHGEEVFDNMYPQIVSKEIYEIVRKKATVNHHGKRSVDVVYLLRNKMKCGYCGQSVNAECGTSQSGKVKRYYKCFGRKRKNGCKKSMMQKETLENYVLTTIMNELKKSEIIDSIVSGILAEQERSITQNSLLKVLLREKKQVDTAIENMLNAIECGVITASTTKRLKELEGKQSNLECQILVENSKTATRVSAEEIREYYEKALLLNAQMLIDYLVREIVLYDDKIEIYFNTPTRMSPDENRGFSVCTGFVGNLKTEIIIRL